MALSERALSHSVHLITLGVYSWRGKATEVENWRCCGGGDRGSIFHSHSGAAPTFVDWIQLVLLSEPANVMDCIWYNGEECLLLLLSRLSLEGGYPGVFVAQDSAIRSGAAWICHLAIEHSPAAAAIIGEYKLSGEEKYGIEPVETERAKKIREAKVRFDLVRIKNQKKIACLAKGNFDDDDDDDEDGASMGAPRVIKERPQCQICKSNNIYAESPDGLNKGNVLSFCAYAQASMVLKGSGYLPRRSVTIGTYDNSIPVLDASRFVGTHVTICGHAVHSACWDYHTKGNKDGETKCPICKRLCNCLVPFIDVGYDWFSTSERNAVTKSSSLNHSTSYPPRHLHDFLSESQWRSWDAESKFTVAGEFNSYLSSFSKGAATLWQRFAENICAVSHKAECERLGKKELSRDYGEFQLENTFKIDDCIPWQDCVEVRILESR